MKASAVNFAQLGQAVLVLATSLLFRTKHFQWAQLVWQILAAQGQKIIKEGKTLETAEENLAELTLQAQAFADKQLPILKALQVV